MKPKDAVVVILRNSGRVLVIRRGPATPRAGYWMPPSGTIEPGESARDAIVREMHEELRLDVVPGEKVWECQTDDGRYRLHWWTAAAQAVELHPATGEISDIRWVDAADFERLTPTFAVHHEFFRTVLPTLR